MLTRALRLHGTMDVQLDTFHLPECGDDDILAEVICDSLCVSSLKAIKQGTAHSRVPKNIHEILPIIGHEFSGRILKVGSKWRGSFEEGDNFAIQPDLKIEGNPDTIGYSFPTVGGNATHVLIPNSVMEMECLMKFEGDAYYMAALSEPLSCLIRAIKAQYHVDQRMRHVMGILNKGSVALLGGAGPMGLAMLALLVASDAKPQLIKVYDIDRKRLDRAAQLLTQDRADEKGIELKYLASDSKNPVETLLRNTNGQGFSDVFVFAPDASLIEIADKILSRDGCLNFFAGPDRHDFSSTLNFYNVHYAGTHVVGTSGGNIDDMRDALQVLNNGKIDPSIMVTHIGGLASATEATLKLNEMGGGKKLIYPHLDIPLISIDDFAEQGKADPLFEKLHEICKKHGGIWNSDAERWLIENGPKL